MADKTPTIDGRGLKVGSTWANTVNDGVTANSINTSTAYWNSGINAIDLSGFNITQVERFFVEFDTSDVAVAPTSGTFKLYGKHSDDADVICVQASFATAGALATGDWDSWNESSPVNYTNELTTWNDNGYNEFTLTAAALSAIASLDEFQMICLEADNDYDQSSAGSGLSISSGYYTRNESGKEPTLSFVDAAVPAAQQPGKILSGKVSILGGSVIIK